jgi:hypothetical protein
MRPQQPESAWKKTLRMVAIVMISGAIGRRLHKWRNICEDRARACETSARICRVTGGDEQVAKGLEERARRHRKAAFFPWISVDPNAAAQK